MVADGRRTGDTSFWGGLFVKRLVICAASAVMSCSSVVVLAGGTPGAAAASTPVANGTFQLAPGHSRLRAADNTMMDKSTNWAGYVQSSTTNHTFTAVSDTFDVPTADPGAAVGTQYVADWVGIGGFAGRDRTLVQTGIQTELTTKSKGGPTTVSYDAWTETLPQPEKPLALTLNPGDEVTASVQQKAKNTWIMTVDDVTTGQVGTKTVKYHSKGLSAEAIHERPCLRGPCAYSDLATLAQTSDVTFDPGSFSESAPGTDPVDVPLLDSIESGLTLTEVEMTDDDNPPDTIAIASAPSATDDGFTVADGSSPPPPPPPTG